MIRGLSIKEPHAGLILCGEKTIETRTWKTNYRGTILICVSQSPKSDISGHAIATATIKACRTMVKGDEPEAMIELYDRANAWILDDIRPINQFPIKGSLGLFHLKQETIKRINYL